MNSHSNSTTQIASNASKAFTSLTALCRRYQPILCLHPNERFFPISFEEYLACCNIGRFDLKSQKLLETLKRGPLTQSQLRTFGKTIETTKWEETSLYLRPDADLYKNPPPFNASSPVYVNSYIDGSKLYVNYSWLYSGDPGKMFGLQIESHQCDIEHVVFEFPLDAVTTQAPPLRIYGCTHGFAEGRWTDWNKMTMSVSTPGDLHQRPLIFAARGSHGCYSMAGEQTYLRFGGFGNDDTSDQGAHMLGSLVLIGSHEKELPMLQDDDKFDAMTQGFYPFQNSIIGDIRMKDWKGDMGALHVTNIWQQGWFNQLGNQTGLESAPVVSRFQFSMSTTIFCVILICLLLFLFIFLIRRHFANKEIADVKKALKENEKNVAAKKKSQPIFKRLFGMT